MSQQATTSNSEIFELKEAASSSSPEDITQSQPQIQESPNTVQQTLTNAEEKKNQPILNVQPEKINEINANSQVIANKQETIASTTGAEPNNMIIQQNEVQTQPIQTQNVLYFQPRTIKIMHLIFFLFMLYVHLSEVFDTDNITPFQDIKSSSSKIDSQKKKDKSKKKQEKKPHKVNSKNKKSNHVQDQDL